MMIPNLNAVRTQTAVTNPDTAATKPAAGADGYRGLDAASPMTAPDQGFTNYGDKLTSTQSDMFNAGYYQSRDQSSDTALSSTYKNEVDGKFGPRTKQAVSNLQTDLAAAGLYKGTPSGAMDKGTLDALNQLKGGAQLPQGIDPQVAARLQRFGAAAAKPASVMPADPNVSTFAPAAKKAPVDLSGAPAASTPADQGKPVDGETVMNNVTKVLGNAVDQMDPNHTLNPAQRLEASARLAENLAAQPNTVDLLTQLGQGQLGFDPQKTVGATAADRENNIDGFLKGAAQILRTQEAELLIKGKANQMPVPQTQMARGGEVQV